MPDALSLRLGHAHHWDCNETLENLGSSYHQINQLEQQQSAISNDIVAAKRTLDEMQTIATLSVEGKNAEERKARLTEHLKNDADYQRVLQHLDSLQGRLDGVRLTIGTHERLVRYIEYQLKYKIAMLRVIGGE